MKGALMIVFLLMKFVILKYNKSIQDAVKQIKKRSI